MGKKEKKGAKKVVYSDTTINTKQHSTHNAHTL